jgi:PAS domain S-box-containing protein
MPAIDQKKPISDIHSFQKRITELENEAKILKRRNNLLYAFMQASTAISSASTPEEIIESVAQTLKFFDIASVIYSIDQEQSYLTIISITLDSQALAAAEKMVGLTALGFKIQIDSVESLRIAIREQKTHFSRDSESLIYQVLPPELKKNSKRLAKLVDMPVSISSPLIRGNHVLGLLTLLSDDFSEDDIALIPAFAQQLATSLQNAEHMQHAHQEILERTKIEAELTKEHNRIQKNLEIADVIILVLNEAGNIEQINQKGCEVLGYSENELVGNNWFEFIVPDIERKNVRNAFSQILNGKFDSVENIQHNVVTKASEIRLIAWHSTRLTNDEGIIIGTLSSGEDITERVNAENTLRESEERFRSIVQASPMGIHIYTLESDGRLIFCGSNPAADEILWVDNNRFCGMTIEEAFPGLADTEIPERYRRAAEFGEAWQTTQITYEDRWISGAFDVYAVQTSPGKMAAIFVDITDRKRALEEQGRLANILEATSDVVGTATISGKLIYLNKAGKRLFGLSDNDDLKDIDQHINQPLQEFLDIQAENIEAVLLYGIWSGESIITDLSGRKIPVSIVLLSHLDDEKNPDFISAVIRDISELRQAEELILLQSTALNAAATGIYIADHQGYIIWANPTLSTITGYSLEEIIGSTSELFNSDRQSLSTQQQITAELAKGNVWQGELINKRKDGKTYFSEQTITPVFNAENQVAHFISIQQDISKRKEDERALKQHASQLVLLNDIGEQIVSVLELERVFQHAVQLVQKSFSYHHVSIFTVDSQEKVVILQDSSGGFKDLYPPNHTLKIGEGMVGWVAKYNQALLSNNVSTEKQYINFFPDKHPTRSELSVPIHMGDNVIGVLDTQSPNLDAFDDNDVTTMQTLADQIAIAIENARLHAAIKRSLEETQAMAAINQALNETLDLDRILQLMVDSIGRIIPHVERVVAHLFDEDNAALRPAAVSGIVPDRKNHLQMHSGQGIAGEVIKTGKSINVRDTQDDQRFIPIDGVTYLRSLLVVPVQSGDRRVGTISVSSTVPRAFTDADERLLTMIGVQVSIALQNAQLYATTRRSLAESNMLFYINNLIIDSVELDVESILHLLVDHLQQNFNYYHVHVYLIDQESGSLIANQGSGEIGKKIKDEGYLFKSEEGVVGYAASVGEAFMSNNLDEVIFFRPNPHLPNTSAEIAAPLRVREQILGVLDILHQPPNTFDEDDFRFLTTVADQIAVVLDKAMLYTQLQEALQKEQQTRAQLVQTEKLAAMGRLVASVAHELNNPLQAIQNALYLVRLEENLSNQATEDLQVAIDEGSRMAGLISRLRDTYRPVETTDYNPETINLLVDEVRKLLDTHLRHNDVKLEFSPDPDLPEAIVIRDQIKQVILNLCINAIESMPNGGQLKIRTKYLTTLDEVHIQVSDTGPGIREEVKTKIFEPFFTTKDGGTGLGLAVSYEIAHNHGGNITAENNKGPGSTFTLSIPRRNSMLE